MAKACTTVTLTLSVEEAELLVHVLDLIEGNCLLPSRLTASGISAALEKAGIDPDTSHNPFKGALTVGTR